MYVVSKGRIGVAACEVPNSEKIAICIKRENIGEICGYFTDDDHAETFMREVARLCGVENDE